MTKTFKELQEIDQLIGQVYQKTPTLKDTKFGYAYKRFTDKYYTPMVRDFQDELTIIRAENALENNTTKEVLIDPTNPRGFKYSKEGLIACMSAEKTAVDAWDNKEVEIAPFICKTIPQELTEEQVEQLKGIIFE